MHKKIFTFPTYPVDKRGEAALPVL